MKNPHFDAVALGDVQDHAVVEVGIELEVRRPVELVLEVPEFGHEALQSLRFLFELLQVLGPLSLVLGLLYLTKD